MSPDHSLSYPPAAHLSDQSATRPQPVQSQPSPVPSMSTNPSKADKKSGGAERIRGGCIPCPDGSICYIIPIPCLC
ncbi:hypothetical protein OH77DRAFT_1375945, partial [Trametes cingulata]